MNPPSALLLVLALTGLAATPLSGDSCIEGSEPAFHPSGPRVPVILVPGVTGSKLRDRQTGEVVWGTGSLLFRPQDGGYALALPIDGASEPRLEAFEIIEEMSLARIIRKEIYRPFLRKLEAWGYRRGDLTAPRADDTVFGFPYDWRRSNVEAARLLLSRLERLRSVRGEERLTVDLVCQSNGAHICRYLLKYGGASLAEAEAGQSGPPGWLAVRKLILVGSSNGGGLRILRELDRGRTYISLIGRKMQPETLFTFPAIYQDLPVYRTDHFVDAAGRALDLDLFDAETWRQSGWSVFSRAARRRVARRPDLFGDEGARVEFLRRSLELARRFHHLLIQDVEGFVATRYYLLQSTIRDTPEQAVLVEKQGELRPFFSHDCELRRRPALHARVSSPGDGHATITSQMWLSPQEKSAVTRPPVYVESGHMEVVFDPGALRCLAEFLAGG